MFNPPKTHLHRRQEYMRSQTVTFNRAGYTSGQLKDDNIGGGSQ